MRQLAFVLVAFHLLFADDALYIVEGSGFAKPVFLYFFQLMIDVADEFFDKACRRDLSEVEKLDVHPLVQLLCLSLPSLPRFKT